MKRFACAALVVTLGSVAHADTPKREPAPDEVADVESAEANLEPTMAQEPRKGLSLALAAGGGILMGGDIGVGRGPTFSLRLGHTATRKTNITFELVRNDALHNQKGVGAGAMEGPTLYDINVGLFAGAQHYTSRSFWLRAATGLTTFVEDATSAKGTGG